MTARKDVGGRAGCGRHDVLLAGQGGRQRPGGAELGKRAVLRGAVRDDGDVESLERTPLSTDEVEHARQCGFVYVDGNEPFVMCRTSDGSPGVVACSEPHRDSWSLHWSRQHRYSVGLEMVAMEVDPLAAP